MTHLTIYPEHAPEQPLLQTADDKTIISELAKANVVLERWKAAIPLAFNAHQDHVLAAYAKDVARLKLQRGYKTADVVRVMPEQPDIKALREKFLKEHIHIDDEVRFFVEGSGSFYLHIHKHVYVIVCEQGDLLNVPANTPHWFDMGPRPFFTAIRLFTNEEGWVGHLTGSTIAQQFPLFEQVESYAELKKY